MSIDTKVMEASLVQSCTDDAVFIIMTLTLANCIVFKNQSVEYYGKSFPLSQN